MFAWLKYIRVVKQVDRLCFEKRGSIKPKLFGKPGYSGGRGGKYYYAVPIFFDYDHPPGVFRLAVHEVRHRVQREFPGIKLLTQKDAPGLTIAVDKVGKKLSAREMDREIDAEIIEQIASPLFSTNPRAFLELILGKAKPQKES